MVENRSILAPQLPSSQKILYHGDTRIEITILQLHGWAGQDLCEANTKMEINMQEVVSVARVPWETRRQQGRATEKPCWVISTEAKAKSAVKE